MNTTVSKQQLDRNRRQRIRREMDRDDALMRLLDERVGWMGLPLSDAQRHEVKVWLFGKLRDEWPGLTLAACLEVE